MLDQIGYTNLKTAVFEKVQVGLWLSHFIFRILYFRFLISFFKCLSHTACTTQQLPVEKQLNLWLFDVQQLEIYDNVDSGGNKEANDNSNPGSATNVILANQSLWVQFCLFV